MTFMYICKTDVKSNYQIHYVCHSTCITATPTWWILMVFQTCDNTKTL